MDTQHKSSKLSRRRFLSAAGMGAVIPALAACGGAASTQPPGATTTATGGGAAAPVATTAASSATAASVAETAAATTAPVAAATEFAVAESVAAGGKIPSPAPGVPDAYNTFPKEYFRSVQNKPGSGGSVSTFQLAYQPPVPGRAENRYLQELEQRVGLTINADLVPSQNYREKLTAVIAGGEIPDLTVLTPDAFLEQYQPILQGAFADLTPYLTGDAIKEFPNLARFPEYLWKNVAINGKIYGVPRETGLVPSVLVFRQDWADKVGISNPKNAEEFLQLMKYFTQKDPDGNGQNDTYGISGGGYSRSFFENMFRVPNQWRRNADGSLVHQVETEEYRQMVAFMRSCYEAGVFHPDAGNPSKDYKEPFAAGKYGAFADGPGALPKSYGLRALTKQVTPSANVTALLPPGHDGAPATTYNSRGYWGFVAVSASAAKDEARLKELLRVLDYYAAPFGSEEWFFLQYGLKDVHHTIGADGTPERTEQANREIGDLNYLSTPPSVLISEIPGEAEWMQKLMAEHIAIGVDNPVLTIYSPAFVARGSELGQLQDDKIAAIVTGREPLDAWESFVNDWRSRGGDDMRNEYQQALKG